MTESKVVLITGASSGIGMNAAIRLNALGFVVYAAARRMDKLKKLEQYQINILYLDVTIEETMINCVKNIIEKEKKIDILINNAGYGLYGPLEEISMAEAKYQYEVNVFGLARMTQLVLPYMRKNKVGRIINVSSIGGKVHLPLGSWYHSSKFAIEGLSDCLRAEVKEFGIKVILIEPGNTISEWTKLAISNLDNNLNGTAYINTKQSIIKLFNCKKIYAPVDTVVKSIEKAVIHKNPKTRYVTTFNSKSILVLRKLLPDKVYDKILLSLIHKF